LLSSDAPDTKIELLPVPLQKLHFLGNSTLMFSGEAGDTHPVPSQITHLVCKDLGKEEGRYPVPLH
jgi:hypothetical protein